MRVKAKKHLGQHFLTDLGIAQAIADAMTGKTCRKVLEIGPGMGVLTQFLIPREDIDLSVVEIDSESVKYLRINYPTLEIREDDFLEMPLEMIYPEGVNIIGNFPYNISSQIFFKVLDNRDLVPEVVCMLQREVAARIAEPPGKKDYGILSVFLQAYYNIEYLFTVDEHVFSPPPKVKSAVIRMTRNDVTDLGCDEALFRRVVKATFNQRRKTIRNSLRAVFPAVAADHPLMDLRPERLSVEDYVGLTNWVAEQLPE